MKAKHPVDYYITIVGCDRKYDDWVHEKKVKKSVEDFKHKHKKAGKSKKTAKKGEEDHETKENKEKGPRRSKRNKDKLEKKKQTTY